MKLKSLLAFGLFAVSVGVQADVLSDYKNNYFRLDNLIDIAEEQDHLPPMLTNESDAKLINALTNDEILQSFLDEPEERFIELVDSCSYGNNIYKRYFMFNPTTEQITLTMQGDNLTKFQNELSAFLNFNIRCTANLIPRIDKFYTNLPDEQKTPIRKRGAQQTRLGISQVYVGALGLLVGDYLSLPIKQSLSSNLSLTAPKYIVMMSKNDRKELIMLIEKYKSSIDVSLHTDLGNMINLLKTEPCNELCLL